METPVLSDVRDVADAIDLAKMVDDAIDPRCQVGPDDNECGEHADWLATASCGHAWYFCIRHKIGYDAAIADPRAIPGCHLHTPFVAVTISWVKL